VKFTFTVKEGCEVWCTVLLGRFGSVREVVNGVGVDECVELVLYNFCFPPPHQHHHQRFRSERYQPATVRRHLRNVGAVVTSRDRDSGLI